MRSSIEKDLNKTAASIVAKATKQKPKRKIKVRRIKNPAAVMLGRLGGLKGGVNRAKKLTAKQRREIAQKAARARWGKK